MRTRIIGLAAAALILSSLLFAPKSASSDYSHFVYLPLIVAPRQNPLHQGEATYGVGGTNVFRGKLTPTN